MRWLLDENGNMNVASSLQNFAIHETKQKSCYTLFTRYIRYYISISCKEQNMDYFDFYT